MNIFLQKINQKDLDKYKNEIIKAFEVIKSNNENSITTTINNSYIDNLRNKNHLYIVKDQEKIVGISFFDLWDNENDIYFVLEATSDILLKDIYNLLFSEIIKSYPNIKNINTEVYKSNLQQINFFLNNGFEENFNEQEYFPNLENHIIELVKKIK